jgi:Fe-S cluster assembly protein SufB
MGDNEPQHRPNQSGLARTDEARRQPAQHRRGTMALSNPALSQIPEGYKYGWHDSEMKSLYTMKKGLNAEIVAEISHIKGEPQWMTDLRLKAYRHFEARPLPTWGGDLGAIDFQDIYYYVTATDKAVQSWDDVPDYIRRTYDKLGIPQAEKEYLAGVGGQYDSEVVYHNIREDLEKLGVLFMGTDEGLKRYPELFKQYFGTVIPANDNKLAAQNTTSGIAGNYI